LLRDNTVRAKKKLGWLSQASWRWKECVERQLLHEKLPLLLDDGETRVVNALYNGITVKPGWTYICEKRLAVDREYKPCGLRDKAAMFAGTPDKVAYQTPEVVYVLDYKMGNLPGHLPEYDTAQSDQQLIVYGALWCWHHQECEEIHGRQWAPRWNRDSRAVWTREQICELARERIESDLEKIQWCKKHGWPAKACERCDWCKLPCGHEYWEEMYGQSKDD
jgi:hypothetical protein